MEKNIPVPNAAPSLRISPVNYPAANYAVKNWHYSKSMPIGKSIKLGVWERDKFIGVVIFSRGSSRNIGRPFGVKQTEVCELTRVALKSHEVSVTRVVSISLKVLKEKFPGVRVVVSFADPEKGHLGKIYQAGNWVYIGRAGADRLLVVKGKVYQTRTIGKRYNTASLEWVKANIDPEASQIGQKSKFKYIMPLDKEMRVLVEKLRKPYPKEINGANN